MTDRQTDAKQNYKFEKENYHLLASSTTQSLEHETGFATAKHITDRVGVALVEMSKFESYSMPISMFKSNSKSKFKTT